MEPHAHQAKELLVVILSHLASIQCNSEPELS